MPRRTEHLEQVRTQVVTQEMEMPKPRPLPKIETEVRRTVTHDDTFQVDERTLIRRDVPKPAPKPIGNSLLAISRYK